MLCPRILYLDIAAFSCMGIDLDLPADKTLAAMENRANSPSMLTSICVTFLDDVPLRLPE